jgi:hypothetical protein
MTTTVFRRGDRVRLTDLARARGLQPAAETGVICRSPNPTGMGVKVLWPAHGSRSGLYCARGTLEKVNLEPPTRGTP